MFLTNSAPLVHNFAVNSAFEEIPNVTIHKYQGKRRNYPTQLSFEAIQPLQGLQSSVRASQQTVYINMMPLFVSTIQSSMNKNYRFAWTSCIIFYWYLFPLYE